MKEKKQITTRNHYVPQAYLKNWSEYGENIWLYNRLVSHKNVPLWCEKNIKSICFCSNLYSNMGKIKVDEFEEWITLQVENPYLAIAKKIIEGESLTNEDNLNISRYVFVQHLRSPAYYGKRFTKIISGNDFQEMFYKTLLDFPNRKIIDTAPVITHTLEDNCKISHEEYPIHANVVQGEDETEIYVEALVGRQFWLSTIVRLSKNIEENSKRIKWTIIDSNSNDEWLTSDNPVLLLNQYKGGDYNLDGNWGVKNTVIIFPVSPQKLLIAQVGQPFKKINNSSKFQSRINKLTKENSFLHVFSTKENSYLKYEDRLVDEEEYKNIIGMINNLHINFLENETGFNQNNKKK